jgi:preprotein translocase subunit SecE
MLVSKTIDGGSNPSTRAKAQTYMSILKENNVFKFLAESYEEVRHNVTWTPVKELYSSTTLVLVASLIFALLVGLVDFIFSNGLDAFYKSFNQ